MNNIRLDLHTTKFWADNFWRRKQDLSTRSDPELEILKDHHTKTVLEIGCGYGRFSKKVISILKNLTKYTGMEINPYFKQYTENYIKSTLFEYMVRDTYTSEYTDKYDLIILPMNTFPTFTFQSIEFLVKKIKLLLNKNGSFIFSTHKPIIESKINEMSDEEI